MLREIASKIVITIIGGTIGGAFIYLFGLDRVVADVVGEYPGIIFGVMLAVSGLLGLVFVGLGSPSDWRRGSKGGFRPVLLLARWSFSR